MRWLTVLASLTLVSGQIPASAVQAATTTYHYSVTHSLYGAIGIYDRTVDRTDSASRAVSRLQIAVKVLGVVVHRETANQTENWQGDRLISFQSLTTVNGKPLNAKGQARDNKFEVTSPSGTALAPGDVVASDPLSLNRMGAGTVVSIKSGKLESVMVTGGDDERLVVKGVSTPTKHYHVNTATQPNKWEVWMDPQGVPVKFRSLESGGAVDFVLTSSSS